MIGILGALAQEVATLKHLMSSLSESGLARSNHSMAKDPLIQETYLGRTFWRGSLAGQPVVLVEGGVGKVRSTLTATALVSRYPLKGLIFTGVAASLHDQLRLGDVVLAHTAIEHDFGVEDGAGFRPGIDFVPGLEAKVLAADPMLMRLAQQVAPELVKVLQPLGSQSPRILEGLVASGDIFVGHDRVRQRIRAQTGADVVEMEGAAVMRVAVEAGIPCLLVRSVSDEGSSGDFLTLVDKVAHNSATVVAQILGHPDFGPLQRFQGR